jgi:hypothetical protein
VDIEGHMSTIDGQQDGVVFDIDVYLIFLHLLGQLFLRFIALEFGALYVLLFLESSDKVLIDPILEFLEFLFFEL